jgi:hypothetical protein
MKRIILLFIMMVSSSMAADSPTGDWEPGFEDPIRRERAVFNDLWSKYWEFRYYQACKLKDKAKIDSVIEKKYALSRADTKREGHPGPRREEGRKEYEVLLNEMRQMWSSWKDEWQTALKGEKVFDLEEVFWKARTYFLVDAMLTAKSWKEFDQARWDYSYADNPDGPSANTQKRIAQERSRLEAALSKARLAQSLEQSPPIKESKP